MSKNPSSPPSGPFLPICFYYRSLVQKKFQPNCGGRGKGGSSFYGIWLYEIKARPYELDLETPVIHPYLKMDQL